MPIDYDVDEKTAEKEPQQEVRKIIRSGWGAVDTLKREDANYAVRLKTGNDPVLIKFLQDAPYAAWKQHWVNRPGQKSFVCREGEDDRGCPLCS
jgi:hypothetical protein